MCFVPDSAVAPFSLLLMTIVPPLKLLRNENCLQKFGVKESEVHNALLSGDPHDQLGIAYHLVVDNKRIADEAAKAELKDFYVASSPPPVAFSPNEFSPAPVRPHPERIARK